MMEHRSSVIVFRSNAIDNNNDDEKMTPNDVNEEAEDSLQYISTSVYVDYLKCIFVPEKFGAYVVVANTGDRG